MIQRLSLLLWDAATREPLRFVVLAVLSFASVALCVLGFAKRDEAGLMLGVSGALGAIGAIGWRAFDLSQRLDRRQIQLALLPLGLWILGLWYVEWSIVRYWTQATTGARRHLIVAAVFWFGVVGLSLLMHRAWRFARAKRRVDDAHLGGAMTPAAALKRYRVFYYENQNVPAGSSTVYESQKDGFPTLHAALAECRRLVDESLDEAGAAADAQELRSHFLSWGYVPFVELPEGADAHAFDVYAYLEGAILRRAVVRRSSGRGGGEQVGRS